jgi:hypothetical protein
MEPILCNIPVIGPHPGYLDGVRELCSRHGVVLIFDEVITGFRAGPGGAQRHLGVRVLVSRCVHEADDVGHSIATLSCIRAGPPPSSPMNPT